jgi:threonine synthase
MYYTSTRDKSIRKTLSEAMLGGLADDGGLFVPETIPKINLADFTPDLSYPEFAEKLLHTFFAGDILDDQLKEICQEAFTFPIPLTQVNKNTFLLELSHGPTSSFKDIGARFLAACLNRLSEKQKTTILVATSGDTGSAVASAFYQKPNINVIILYPKGQVSERQEHQITCWDDNINALAVKGSFDDCQRLIKSAFQDEWWKTHTHLSSANSINIGRLLPQLTYYAYCSMQFYHQHKAQAGFIIPTGNLGNATAGYWAKLIGFPIREITLSTNANKAVPDYLQSGKFKARPSIATVANAMDVGNPSNFERLYDTYKNYLIFKENVTAYSVSDEEIKSTIKEYYEKYNIILCPHTATASFVREKLSAQPWIVVSTADASKFDTVIEPILKTVIPIPASLQTLLERKTYVHEIEPDLNEIRKLI